jgi:hypothetical protein
MIKERLHKEVTALTGLFCSFLHHFWLIFFTSALLFSPHLLHLHLLAPSIFAADREQRDAAAHARCGLRVHRRAGACCRGKRALLAHFPASPTSTPSTGMYLLLFVLFSVRLSTNLQLSLALRGAASCRSASWWRRCAGRASR